MLRWIRAKGLGRREGTAGIQKAPSPSTGEGWDGGEVSLPSSPLSDEDPLALNQPKTLPLSESGDETISESNNIEDKNIYDYGRNDLDPSVDYHYEPLNPEEQALFDYEARLESGDFPEGNAPKEPPPPPPSAYAEYSDTLRRIKDAAAREGVPVLPNPLAGKFRRPAIRSP